MVVSLALELLLLAGAAAGPVHNVVLFVPDGLRANAVSELATPSIARIGRLGVRFANSHSVFPTFTMPNASALATGHFLGDTGVFGNTLFTGYRVAAARGSVTPFIEDDAVLGDIDEHFQSDVLGEDTLLAAARAEGYSTAALGKLGPTLVFDHTSREGTPTLVFDDATGTPRGIPVAPGVLERIEKAGLPAAAPPRGTNGLAGDASTPGTLTANLYQQAWFRAVATQVVLPLFKERGKPFLLVFWSRDPDGTQHNNGDSLGRLIPGLQGPAVRAATRNVDDALESLLTALDALGLAASTDVIVSADHGFSTISKQSATSPSARQTYSDVPRGQLPPGFLALDLAQALGMTVYDPDGDYAPVAPGTHPKRGDGALLSHPEGSVPAEGGAAPPASVVVAANGGSDLVYLPGPDARELAPRIVDALLEQDYVSGIFLDDALGSIPGTLPLTSVRLKGAARTPGPALVVNFRSFPVPGAHCPRPLLCVAEVADSTLQQGQGMHGSFSRADTANAMAALGPDFKRRFVDAAPAGNPDVGRTIARLMRLEERLESSHPEGERGRVLEEALVGGHDPAIRRGIERSAPAHGLSTVLVYEEVGGERYGDAAGFDGRTVGLRP